MAKLRIHIDVPTPGSTTMSNLLGLSGALGLALSAGGLSGNVWVSVLVASVLLLLVAAVSTYNAAPAGDEPGPATARSSVDERPARGGS